MLDDDNKPPSDRRFLEIQYQDKQKSTKIGGRQAIGFGILIFVLSLPIGLYIWAETGSALPMLVGFAIGGLVYTIGKIMVWSSED